MLKDKIIFVTGGTGYIGTEICKTAINYGAKVIFSYYKNHDLALELKKESDSLYSVQMDQRNVNETTKKIEELYKQFPKIDVLVNNSALSQIMPLSMLEEDDVDLVMDTNIKGTIFVTKAIARGMIRNKSGVIINLGSIAGSRLLDVPITYAMSKAAITGMTFSLAGELKRFGIRVNSVIPGLLDGGVGKGVPEDLKADFLKHCAVGRVGTAKDVAELICFLASDKASYINAQNITIDGGL